MMKTSPEPAVAVRVPPFIFSSRRRHTRYWRDWSSDVCSSDLMLARMEHFVRQPHGMFLVTGPTGSGKSTTLYSALKNINLPDKKIITIEDPVEYQMRSEERRVGKEGRSRWSPYH